MSDEAGLRVLAVVGALALVAIGIALIRFVRSRWYGAYRQWAVDQRGPVIVYVVPALAAAMLGAAIALLLPPAISGPIVILAMLLIIGSIFVSTGQPRWWGPDWYHKVQRELIVADQDGWDSAYVIVPDDAVSLSPGDLAASVFDDQPVTARWHGHLVEEPNKGLRNYGVRLVTERPGVLEVRPDGLAFLPSLVSQRFLGRSYVVPIRAEEVEGIWVVPPGADPNGVVPQGLPHRWSPRVVVQTVRGAFMYVLPHAHDRAKTISEVLGCPLSTRAL